MVRTLNVRPILLASFGVYDTVLLDTCCVVGP